MQSSSLSGSEKNRFSLHAPGWFQAPPQWLALVISCLLLFLRTPFIGLAEEPTEVSSEEQEMLASIEELFDDDHFLEEMGVNLFTAPSIEKILEDLAVLRPVPYDSTKRDLPRTPSADRTLIALRLGTFIAHGFALMDAEARTDIEETARAMLRHADGLSITSAVVPRARSLAEKGLRGEWDKMREELRGAQRDAERAMVLLRDEEIAHLISLGGWLRGLEFSAAAVVNEYTTERAAVLVRPDLLDYFIERLETLHPDLAAQPFVQALTSDIQKILLIVGDNEMLSKENVEQIYQIANTRMDALYEVEAIIETSDELIIHDPPLQEE